MLGHGDLTSLVEERGPAWRGMSPGSVVVIDDGSVMCAFLLELLGSCECTADTKGWSSLMSFISAFGSGVSITLPAVSDVGLVRC